MSCSFIPFYLHYSFMQLLPILLLAVCKIFPKNREKSTSWEPKLDQGFTETSIKDSLCPKVLGALSQKWDKDQRYIYYYKSQQQTGKDSQLHYCAGFFNVSQLQMQSFLSCFVLMVPGFCKPRFTLPSLFPVRLKEEGGPYSFLTLL